MFIKLIKGLYWNQYLELNPKGKGAAARKNGNIIITVALLMNLVSLMFILVILIPAFGHFFKNLIEGIGLTGRSTGKIIAALLMALIYPVVLFTLGTEENFKKTIAEFEALPEAEQKTASSNSLKYFFISIGITVLFAMLMLF